MALAKEPDVPAQPPKLARLPIPLPREVRRVLAWGHPPWQEGELQAWAHLGWELAQGGPRAWEATEAYLTASLALPEPAPFAEVLAWGQRGARLARRSPRLAEAYFRASPSSWPHLSSEERRLWAQLGERLYDGSWHSLTLARKFYEVSPSLFGRLAYPEGASLILLLRRVAQGSSHLAMQGLELWERSLLTLPAQDRRPFLDLLEAVAIHQPLRAFALFLEAPTLLLALGAAARADLLRVARQVAEEQPEAGYAFTVETARAFQDTDGATQGTLLALAMDLARRSPSVAQAFLESARVLLPRLGGAGVSAWAREGLSALDGGANQGLAYFRRESLSSRRLMERLAKGVELTSVRGLLQRYCQALSGRSLPVLPLGELANKGMGWVAGDLATTQGTAIFLPATLDEFGGKGENFLAYKVYAAHQAGHVEFGSFAFSFHRPGVCFADLRPHLAQAGSRDGPPPSDYQRFFDLFPHRGLAKDLFQVAEEWRIDHRIRHEYRGLAGPYAQVQRHALAQRPALAGLPLRQAFVEALLDWSLDPSRRWEVPQPIRRAFARGIRILQPLGSPEATVEDAAEATLRLYALAQQIPNQAASETTSDDPSPADSDPSADGEGERDGDLGFLEWVMPPGAPFSPEPSAQELPYRSAEAVAYRSQFQPELVQTFMRLHQDAQANPSQGSLLSPEQLQALLARNPELQIAALREADLPASSGLFLTNLLREAGQLLPQGQAPPSSPAERLPGEPLPEEASLEKEPATYLYDEWDFRARGYRPHWCRLRERVVPEGTAHFYDHTVARYAPLVAAIRKRFQGLRPQRFQKVKRLAHGEDFELDAVVQAVVERQAGLPPDEKLYWRRNKRTRDVAVAFLLDLSASTDEEIRPNPDLEPDWDDLQRRHLGGDRMAYGWLSPWDIPPTRPKRPRSKRIIDVEKEGVVLLVEALEAVGDTYGIYGFSSYGREKVELYVVKELEEAFSPRVKGRIDRLEPIRGTRMGTAIRHTITKLERLPNRTKLLFLLSDGRPQDYDYGRDRTEKAYAIHDTHMALLEARRKEIVPFCLTVDRQGQDYLRQMCGDIGYEVVEDIEAFPSRLPTLYHHLTR